MDFNGKLLFLEKLLGKAKYSHNTKEALFYCPFCHHHKPKLSVNIETDSWQCFPCGKAGRNLLFLIKKRGNRDSVDEYLKKYKSDKASVHVDKKAIAEFTIRLPKEFVPIVECRNSVVGIRAWGYLTQVKKILPEDILRHKIGLAIGGQYADSIIFPSFNKKGFLNYFTTRSYTGKYVSATVPKGYKSQFIANELNIDFRKPIVLVEGYTDMLKSVSNTVPLFGKTLLTESVLFETIVLSGVPAVYLALDLDAQKDVQKIAKKFMQWDVPVYIVGVGPFKDVGEMEKDEFVNRYEMATLCSRNDLLRERMRNL